MRFALTILISTIFIVFISCKKDVPFTKDHLDFSADTVLFDTIFTTVGSTTQSFKIYNRNNQKILIDEIELMGGSSSPFRINIDGVSGTYHESIELPANDSLFAFVEVTLEVNNQSNPLVISDSIRFRTNGLNQYVNLDVWGQDAYFHVWEIAAGTWATDKPHVLYGDVAVGYPGIDSNLTLTIPAGTHIYGHKNSRLVVYKSTLNIEGTYGNEVVFEGDRLESFYEDISGQWWGILLAEAENCNIDYAIIKNGSVGLQVDSTQGPQALTMTNTIIDNSDFFNLNVNAGANVTVENCLLGKAGLVSVYLFAGGEYHFTHNNIVNYWTGSRSGPALLVKNWWVFENTVYCRPVVNTRFDNNVIYGNIEKELEVDTIDCGIFDMVFNHNLIRRNETYSYANFVQNIWNQDPSFIDVTMDDFHFNAGSPLNGAADNGFANLQDIEGTFRSAEPDIGCYEGP